MKGQKGRQGLLPAADNLCVEQIIGHYLHK